MSQSDSREKVVQKLLLAWQLKQVSHPGLVFEEPVPDGTVIGFRDAHDKFLTSVVTQVLGSTFITQKQFDVVAKMLRHREYSFQFSQGIDLPSLPPQFRWVNFDDENLEMPPIVYKPENHHRVDSRDAGMSTYQVGKRTIDLTETANKPYGTLTVEGDELVFYPQRYPTTQIKPLKFRWDGPTQSWRHKGIYREVVEKVVALFGDVRIENVVEEKLAEQLELVEVPEDIANHATLFDFQKEATQFLLSHPRCLLALAPGLGKTATSILAAKQQREAGEIKTVGIVAPKSLLTLWQDEIEKWAGEWAIILHDDFGPQPLDSDWYIVNYDKLSRGTVPDEIQACDMLIFDETILLSSHGRVQEKDAEGKSRWVFKTKRVQAAYRMGQDVSHVWELSGGPTSKFVDDLWAQLHILDPKRFSSYWRFANEYCVVTETPWGKQISGNKPGAAQLIQRRFSDVMLSRSQDQVLDLPDWIFETVQIPMSKKQASIYDSMEQKWFAELATSGGTVKLSAPNALTHRLRLTQIASNPILLEQGLTAISPKWDALKELVQIRPRPIIVWVQYIETAKRVSEMLRREGWRVEVLIGETPAAARGDIVNRFQSGEVDVIVAHPKVGKFGLTLTATRTAIYLEAGPDGDDYYQSLHRVRRIGTTHSPLIIHVKSLKLDGHPTVDHLTFDLLEGKADTTFEITTDKLKKYFEGREKLCLDSQNSKPSG